MTSDVLVLAIETATADTEVALCDAAGPLAEFAVRRGRRHVESLHPAIEQVLAEGGAALSDLACIAVDVGPGLFTGLRVGVTTAKVLAASTGVPLVAASSLEVLVAAAAPFAGGEVQVVPVVDMRRGEVAWVLRGQIELGPPAALGVALASADPLKTFLLVGDGAERYEKAIHEVATGQVRFAGKALVTPPARTLGAIAVSRLDSGETVDPARLTPLYLREADVKIGWDSRPTTA